MDLDYLENGYKVLYPILRILGNTLCNPCQIPNLLLLQLHVTEEHSVLELLQERFLVQPDLHLEEPVLELRSRTKIVVASSLRRRQSRIGEKGAVLHDVLTRLADLVHLLCLCQLVVPFRPETPDGRKEFRACFFREFGVEGVDGDVDCAPVGFEGKDAVHDVGCGWAEGAAEVVEVFEVGFVHCVADDFDVEVVEICR